MKLFQLTKRDGSNLGEPMTGEQLNEIVLAAAEEVKELEIKLEEANQEIASLQQCDCIQRGAE